MNNSELRFPTDGCVISFSGGTIGPDPKKWRFVTSNGSDKLLQILSRFPSLQQIFAAQPILINAYPATFSPPAKIVFVDSYCRWQTFCSGLMFAAQQGMTCIITAMPLMAAHMLLQAINWGYLLPSRIILMLGGYYCPYSLERFFIELLGKASSAVTVLHLYGVAEIEAGMLAAQRTTESPEMDFQAIDPNWRPIVEGGYLCFQRISDPACVMPTGDPAQISGTTVRLQVPSPRLSLFTRDLLEGWSHDDWLRRTGFLHRDGIGFSLQCRADELPDPELHECEHYDFNRVFAQSWLEKPCWG
jgi:hypothetical protein